MTSKAQTATEYLIILAVVIVIALIVVGVLGGIPSIGGGASKKSSDILLANQKIGIEKYAIQDGYTKLIVKNNHFESVKISNLTFAGVLCESSDIPFTLKIGEKKTITCNNINSTLVSSTVSPSVAMTWIDRATSSTNVINVKGFEVSDGGVVPWCDSSYGVKLNFDGYDLCWQKNVGVSSYNWTNAINYCDNLNLEGLNNWELPSYDNWNNLRIFVCNEQSLSCESELFDAAVGDALNSHYQFDGFMDTFYWSGNLSSVDTAWYFSMGYGGLFEDMGIDNDFRAVCVSRKP